MPSGRGARQGSSTRPHARSLPQFTEPGRDRRAVRRRAIRARFLALCAPLHRREQAGAASPAMRARRFATVRPGTSTSTFSRRTGATRRSCSFIHGGYWRMLVGQGVQLRRARTRRRRGDGRHRELLAVPEGHIDEIVAAGTRCAGLDLSPCASSSAAIANRCLVTGHSAGGQLTRDVPEYRLARDLRIAGDDPSRARSGQRRLRPAPDPLHHDAADAAVRRRRSVDAQHAAAPHRAEPHSPLLCTWGDDGAEEFAAPVARLCSILADAAGIAASIWAQPGCNHFTAIYGFEDPQSSLCRRLFRLMGAAGRAMPGTAGCRHCSRCTGSRSRSARSMSRTTSHSKSRTARSSASSVPTGPARPRCSGCSPAISRRIAARSSSADATSRRRRRTSALGWDWRAHSRCRARSVT